MIFQVLDLKGRNFLELLDNNLNPLEPSTIKGRLQLQYFGHSNSLCTRATRAIINHTPIGEYQLRFFPREEFACPCSVYPIEMRHHILHECKRFNNYQNLRRDSISHFSQFLIFNRKAFSFENSIVLLNCQYIVIFLFSLLYQFFSLSFFFFILALCNKSLNKYIYSSV